MAVTDVQVKSADPMQNTRDLDSAEASRMVQAVVERLKDMEAGAAVAVVDSHGELIAFQRTDGCPLPSIQNAINKAFTAAREGKESGEVGEASRTDPFPMTNFGDPRYTGWGGGIPVLVDNVVVGAIGVSGLPEAEDVLLAKSGVLAFEQSSRP